MSRLLRIRQVAEMTGIPEATLRFWRSRGDKGPQSANLGGRRVVYREEDVIAWVNAQFDDQAAQR